jgi:hypothetical protein
VSSAEARRESGGETAMRTRTCSAITALLLLLLVAGQQLPSQRSGAPGGPGTTLERLVEGFRVARPTRAADPTQASPRACRHLHRNVRGLPRFLTVAGAGLPAPRAPDCG